MPLSPKSSQTLRKHHGDQVAQKVPEHDDVAHDPTTNQQQLVPHASYPHYKDHDDSDHVDAVRSRPRRSRSDSEGALVHRPRRRTGRHRPRTDEEDLVEDLPDRFDPQGHPIYDEGTRPQRWTSRRGEFEYHSPRRRRGLDVQGQWVVGGTDGETVEQAARQITTMLEGRGGWLGILGGILSTSLGRDEGRQGLIGDASGGGGGGGDERRDRRRERERDRDRDRRSRRDDDGDSDGGGSAAIEYGTGDWREDRRRQRRRRMDYD